MNNKNRFIKKPSVTPGNKNNTRYLKSSVLSNYSNNDDVQPNAVKQYKITGRTYHDVLQSRKLTPSMMKSH